MNRRIACIVAVSTLIAVSLSAHDFWIEPSNFRPKVGELLEIQLRVGEKFVGDPVPRRYDGIAWFKAVTPTGERELEGFEEVDPAGMIKVTEPGAMLIGYRGRESYVELPASKVTRYLIEEGQERLARKLKSTGKQLRPWRENFSRCAKSLISAGPDRQSLYKQKLGFRLELIPQEDPYAITSGKRLPFLLLFEGHALADATVFAVNRADATNPLRAKTDRKGRVSFVLPRKGDWLIKSTHIFPASAGGEAEWESLWASFTFHLAPRTVR